MQNIVSFYTEATPNPETMKFVANRYISQDVIAEFRSAEEAERSPLAHRLFSFPFIQNVFFSQNYITITRKKGTEWDEVIPMLKDFLKNYLESGMPIFKEMEVEAEDDGNTSETVIRIKQILKDYIQPAVEQDGGAIHYKAFDEAQGIVTVRLKGSCSGCPSSMITLKAGIEGLLKRMVPEVKEVVADAA